MFKQLSILVLAIIMATSVLGASMLPELITGKVLVNGMPYEGIQPVVTNIRTGQTFNVETDAGGMFTATVNDGFYPNDRFRVQVCKDDPACVQEVVLPGGIPKRLNFNVAVTNCVGPSFLWKGTTIAGGLLATLLAILAGYQTSRKNAVMKSWVRELFELAENVLLGKLKDIQKDGELTSDFKVVALEYETSHKNRAKIVAFLNTNGG